MTKNKVLQLAFFIFLFLQPVFIYLLHYPPDDCDDKSVHYFSSQFMFASSRKQAMILQNIPVWINREDSLQRKWRTLGRLTNTKNYPFSNTLIYGLTKVQNQLWPESPPLFLYSVKASFLILFIAGLGFLVFVAFRSQINIWLVLITLNLAAFRIFHFGISDSLLRNYGIVPYVPRSSALFIAFSLLISFAAKKPILFLIACLLLAVWHAGLAILFFCILFLTLIGYAFLRLEKFAELLPYFLMLIFSCIGLFMLSFSDNFMNNPGINLEPILIEPDPDFSISLCIQLMGMTTLALGLFFMTYRIRLLDSNDVIIHRTLALSFLWLYLSLVISLFLQYAPFQRALINLLKTPLINEIPVRLTGFQHLLLSWILCVFLYALYKKGFYCLPLKLRPKLILLSSIFFIIFACWYLKFFYKGRYLQLYKGNIPYAKTRCRNMPPQIGNIENLDPKEEAAFFYSLAEFLRRKNNV